MDVHERGAVLEQPPVEAGKSFRKSYVGKLRAIGEARASDFYRFPGLELNVGEVAAMGKSRPPDLSEG